MVGFFSFFSLLFSFILLEQNTLNLKKKSWGTFSEKLRKKNVKNVKKVWTSVEECRDDLAV